MSNQLRHIGHVQFASCSSVAGSGPIAVPTAASEEGSFRVGKTEIESGIKCA